MGRAAAQIHYWWFHAREKRQALEARKREDEHRRIEAEAALRARMAADAAKAFSPDEAETAPDQAEDTTAPPIAVEQPEDTGAVSTPRAAP